MKRTLSLVLALVMVLGTFSSVFAAPVEKPAIEILNELGVILGDAAGLRPEDPLKREEAVVMVSRLKGVEEEAKNFPMAPTFKDITNKLYVPFIAWAQADGTIEGHNNEKFGFGEDLTAKQYAVVLLKVLGYEVDWATVEKLAEEVLEGVNLEAKLTRGSMAEMTLVALNTKVNGEEVTLAEKLNIELPGVEPEVPAKLEVVSVSANNLKQIVVEFNQKVDEDSATKLANYTFALSLESANLLEDGKTVVVTLKNDATVLTGQKEYKLTVNNVQNEAKTAKLEKVEKTFKAIDTTIPTIKDVVALGTKAIKVVFSEPVKELTANSTMRYRIDDKMVSGYVTYVYPNEAIITTSVTVGEHVLKVTDVEDFAGFKVQEPGFSFTVVEDKEAPQIVSAKTVDLDKVIIEFNEPVKAIASASHTTKGSGAKSITIAGNKATIVFNTKMALADTTIYVNGVQDYSDNKEDRSIVISPELDLSRPEVVEVKVTTDVTGTKFVVKFSKVVKHTVKENFVVKKADGTLVNANGLYNGNPIVTITPNGTDAQTDTVTFTTAGPLAKGAYTLEINGVRDTATIENIMLPYAHAFEVKDGTTPKISKTWREGNTTDGYKVYVQFDKDMALEGNGNILDIVKYSYSVAGDVYKPMPVGTTIDLLTPNTVRLNLAKENNVYTVPVGIKVSLVADLAGNWIGGNSNLMEAKAIDITNAVLITEVKTIAKDKIDVTFNSKLININPSDFSVTSATYSNLTLEKFEYDGSDTIATFKIASGHELSNVQHPGTFFVKSSSTSVDEFGVKLNQTGTSIGIVDGIKPTVVEYGVVLAGSTITVTFDEALATIVNAPAVVTVTVNGVAVPVTSIAASGSDLTINLSSAPSTSNTAITVTLNGDLNKTIEAVKDITGNTVAGFTKVIINGVTPK